MTGVPVAPPVSPFGTFFSLRSAPPGTPQNAGVRGRLSEPVWTGLRAYFGALSVSLRPFSLTQPNHAHFGTVTRSSTKQRVRGRPKARGLKGARSGGVTWDRTIQFGTEARSTGRGRRRVFRTASSTWHRPGSGTSPAPAGRAALPGHAAASPRRHRRPPDPIRRHHRQSAADPAHCLRAFLFTSARMDVRRFIACWLDESCPVAGAGRQHRASNRHSSKGENTAPGSRYPSALTDDQ